MIEKSIAKMTIFPTSFIGAGYLLMMDESCSRPAIVFTSLVSRLI
jgi:hypothetical protein